MLPSVVDVTAITGQKIASPLTSWQTPHGPINVEHLAGMSPGGDVLVFFRSPNHDWQAVNVSQIAGQKIASPLTSWQTPHGSTNVEHLAGMSPNGDVLVFFWSPSHDWQAVNVSQITGQKIASPLTSWQTPDGPINIEQLAGMNSNGDVLVFSWSPSHDWQAINVSQITGQKIASPLTSWQTPHGSTNVEHLAGMSPDGDVLVFFRSPSHDWQAVNVSQITGQKIASPLTSWQMPDGSINIEQLAGMNSDGDVLVFSWSPSHDWQAVNVSQIAGQKIASPLTSWQTSNGPVNIEQLAGMNSNGELLVFSWSAEHDWQTIDISQITGQKIASPLTSWQTLDNVEHLGGVNSSEDVLVFSWTAELNYVTQHFDNRRSGWNPQEVTLTVANVRQNFSHLFTQPVDGQVYAQPLYVQNVDIPGKGMHNVVFVATENDTLYAFDADSNQPVLWQRTLIPHGETPVAVTDIQHCDNVAPVIGITSTPVISLERQTMYVVAKTKRVQGAQTTFHQYLHALDIATGSDRPGSPREIQASVAGTGQQNDGHGHVLFLPQWQLNRPGLLLLNGLVYIAFGAHCDFHFAQYHGWIVAYDAATLNQVAAFSSSPDSSASGIWQGGMGLAADSSGAVYCTTGNGVFSGNRPGGKDFGDSVLKLDSHLTLVDSFTPADQTTLLLPGDVDLGSGGVLVLPDQPPGTTKHPQLLITCGKDGQIFLLDRQNLGKYNGPNGPDHVVQSLPLQPGRPKNSQPGVWGGPAYYGGPDGQFVYYGGNGGHLKAFTLQNGELSLSTVGGGQPNQTPDPLPGEGGATPVVSSNQQMAGTGVVWLITRSNPLRLQAYDATNLTVKLFDADTGPWTNPHGNAMIEPTVINGKVYVGSAGQLNVFGLR